MPGIRGSLWSSIVSLSFVLISFGAAGPLPADVLIETGDLWRFFKGTTAPSNPETAWRQADFDDAVLGWEEGPTGIGYGDNDDATVLGDMANGYLAFFARKSFIVATPAAVTSLVLEIDYDDGFAAYLNGTEVARRNLGAAGEEFDFNRAAPGAHEATAGGGPLPERIDLTANLNLLRPNRNVLAVELHNTAIGSTDASFIPRLVTNDAAIFCPTGLTCSVMNNGVALNWTKNRPNYQKIDISRNGVPIAGSPFPGDTVTAQDANPGIFDARYELIATQNGVPCSSITCTSTVQARSLGTLQCVLELVGGKTQARLTWLNIPGTVKAELRREGTLVATRTGGEEDYLDPDVEAEMPEDDTNFEVKLFDADDNTATMTCGADLSLCPAVTADLVDVGGTDRVRVALGNLVKEWETFAVERTYQGTTVVLTDSLPGTETEYVDQEFTPEPGQTVSYTVRPTAPAGEAPPGGCVRSLTFSVPAPELAAYGAPTGGWDYSIDFEAHPGTPMDKYNPVPGEAGNLDGRWIRAVDRDFWDGSAPDEVGAPPDGDAPGGIEVVSRPGDGPCAKDVKVLHLLDPGDPSNPAGSLLVDFPDPFADPSNKSIFLGLDTGVGDRNLLRTGVTFSARWRLDPDPAPYLAATASGDGEPLVGGALGNVGFLFVNEGGALGTEGPTASASFALNSGDLLLFSSAGTNQSLSTASDKTFRSLWVTVEDREGDDTYDVTVYANGSTTPFSFASGIGISLAGAAVDFGAPAGNYLAIGLPDVPNDGDIEIDSVAYKAGVHPPVSNACTPVNNNRPTARIVVTPANGRVTLSGGKAQVTLDGKTSDDGDGGTQGLAFTWSKVNGPAGDSLATPNANSTVVNFTAAGSYVYRLTVNDRQPGNNVATAQTTIIVQSETGGSRNFIRGDADGNGAAEITDAVNILGYLFQGTGDPACLDASDADDSGEIDLTDAVRVLGSLFLGEGPLPSPVNCGSDPTTGDRYDCRQSACP
jgi:hypothetical protein